MKTHFQFFSNNIIFPLQNNPPKKAVKMIKASILISFRVKLSLLFKTIILVSFCPFGRWVRRLFVKKTFSTLIYMYFKLFKAIVNYRYSHH